MRAPEPAMQLCELMRIWDLFPCGLVLKGRIESILRGAESVMAIETDHEMKQCLRIE